MSSQDQSNKCEVLLNSLEKDAYDVLSDGHVSFGEVVSLGGSLAGKANQFQQLSGLEKRDLVLGAVDRALKKILDQAGAEPVEDSEKEAYLARIQKVKEAAEFAKQALPSVLNLAVDVARGKIDLARHEMATNNYQNILMKLFALFSQCFSHPKVLEPKKVDLTPVAPKEEKSVSSEVVAEKTPETDVENKDEKISPPESASS
jgi:hypothetical protein